MHGKRLELVEERGSERGLPCAGRAGEEKSRLARERAVDEFERGGGERGGGGGGG